MCIEQSISSFPGYYCLKIYISLYLSDRENYNQSGCLQLWGGSDGTFDRLNNT